MQWWNIDREAKLDIYRAAETGPRPVERLFMQLLAEYVIQIHLLAKELKLVNATLSGIAPI